MHIAADGSTIASLDLSDTNNEDNEDGMSGNLSSFAVDAAGNLYVSDYNNIYVLDARGQRAVQARRQPSITVVCTG